MLRRCFSRRLVTLRSRGVPVARSLQVRTCSSKPEPPKRSLFKTIVAGVMWGVFAIEVLQGLALCGIVVFIVWLTCKKSKIDETPEAHHAELTNEQRRFLGRVMEFFKETIETGSR
eukprot:TRINITY_DN859_c0_g3_i2.p1 TRINITY_DN859_c0_g3~~TRINITY_DN859_c0_g3_i2.p1  ORF type:complete len:116 (+),score=5.64 TRINITY_DN859_c0_g3_i2:51-398(+)